MNSCLCVWTDDKCAESYDGITCIFFETASLKSGLVFVNVSRFILFNVYDGFYETGKITINKREKL